MSASDSAGRSVNGVACFLRFYLDIPCRAILFSLFRPPQPAAPNPSPVSGRMLADPDPANRLMWRRTFNSWGDSPLNQINRSNVAKPRMAWTRGLGSGVQEGVPLVHQGVMCFPSDLVWEYWRKLPDDLNKHIPFPSIYRNLGIYGDNIIDTSADDFVVAVDANTGKLA